MKSIILIFFILITIIFSSCSKKGEAVIDEKQYIIKFEAKGLTQSIGDFDIRSIRAANNPIKSTKLISQLYFVIFNSQGEVIKSIKQDTTSFNNFGLTEFSLSEGVYKIVAVGTSDYDNSNQHHLHMENLENFEISFPNRIMHTFCSELTPFEVTGTEEPTKKELFIKRVSSQLDVIFEKGIPENSHYATFETPTLQKYNFFGQNTISHLLSNRMELSGINPRNLIKLSIPIFSGISDSNSPKDLKIILYDKNDAPIVSETISNIKFEKNKITEIKGDILEYKNAPFNVKIPTEFDGQIDYEL